MNVHSYCKDKVANLCGINQKLLAEVLSQVSQVCTATNCFFLHISPQKKIIYNVLLDGCFSNFQKSMKKSDESSAGDVDVYQDVCGAAAASTGKMREVQLTTTSPADVHICLNHCPLLCTFESISVFFHFMVANVYL